MKPAFFLNIDILGVCNLACPTCPHGNDDRTLTPRGMMDLELFEAILDKAQRECTVTGVGLFSWTEPLLHPHCALFVTACKLRGIPCHLSTNLNNIRNLDATLRAGPDTLRVSVSGSTNETYQQTHARGDVERVKDNLVLLWQSVPVRQGTIQVTVFWHRYKHNANEEDFMREFATDLGFKFETCEAYLMPLETVLRRWSGERAMLVIEELLWTPLQVAKQQCEPHAGMPCRLQTREITIDANGGVHLCCALYDPKLSLIGRFLDMTLADIQARKIMSEQCSTCLKAGGHVYATFGWKRRERWQQKLGNLRAKIRSWM